VETRIDNPEKLAILGTQVTERRQQKKNKKKPSYKPKPMSNAVTANHPSPPKKIKQRKTPGSESKRPRRASYSRL
jgi:hypothetical protein